MQINCSWSFFPASNSRQIDCESSWEFLLDFYDGCEAVHCKYFCNHHTFCPLHVPHTNVPPLHWCDWWARSAHTFDIRSADSCGPCVGPLSQGLQRCCGFSPIPPTANHFLPPQNFCSTVKGTFLFSILKWLLCSLEMVFPRTVADGICMQLQSSGDLLEIDAGKVFQLRSPQEQHKMCIVIMSCLFWPCTRWSYVSYA